MVIALRDRIIIICVVLLASCQKETDPQPVAKLEVSTFVGDGQDGDVSDHNGIKIGPDNTIYLTGNAYTPMHMISPAGSVSVYPPVDFKALGLWQDASGTNGSFVGDIAFDKDGHKILSMYTMVRYDDIVGTVGTIIRDNGTAYEVLYLPSGWFSGFVTTALDVTTSGAIIAGSLSAIFKVEDQKMYQFAGDPFSGYRDDFSTSARFAFISDLATDHARNIYIPDNTNHCIRKITPTGIVTTIAGNTQAGYKDGPADQAQFNLPTGLCIDNEGNIFVADKGNHRIRKISTDGMVTTVAGDGTEGYSDGTAEEAQFANPVDVAVNNDGHLYVLDAGNLRVRLIK